MLKVGLSNYPQVLSTQLIVSAGVVLVALLTGSPEGTGVFYMSLMIAAALTAVPGTMALMSLPVMVRTEERWRARVSRSAGALFSLVS